MNPVLYCSARRPTPLCPAEREAIRKLEEKYSVESRIKRYEETGQIIMSGIEVRQAARFQHKSEPPRSAVPPLRTCAVCQLQVRGRPRPLAFCHCHHGGRRKRPGR